MSDAAAAAQHRPCPLPHLSELATAMLRKCADSNATLLLDDDESTLCTTPSRTSSTAGSSSSSEQSSVPSRLPSSLQIPADLASKALAKRAKRAKRAARRAANKDKRRAEAKDADPSKSVQPWDAALDALGVGWHDADGTSEAHSEPAMANLELLGSQTCLERTPRAISEASTLSLPTSAPRRKLHRLGLAKTVPQTFELSNPAAAAVVQSLVARFGAWSITFSDASYRIWLSRDLDAAISFKVVSGIAAKVAVVFGDPLCAPSRLSAVINEFESYARHHRWGIAFVSVREPVVRAVEQRAWASVQFAVEQVVDPCANPVLEGASGKRTALHVKHVAKDVALRMYTPRSASPAASDSSLCSLPPGVDLDLEARLQNVYDTAYSTKDAASSPYSTKLSLFALRQVMTYLYTVDSGGTPTGVAGLLQTGPGKYLLDPCVALPSAAAGTTDYLTLSAMAYLRRKGVRYMSFGTEPVRSPGAIAHMSPMLEKDTRMIHAATYDAYGFSGKKTLHDKFHPDTAKEERLYLILASRGLVGQSCCAMAIGRATHLRARPVVRPLVQLVQKERAGARVEEMLGVLAKNGLRPNDVRARTVV